MDAREFKQRFMPFHRRLYRVGYHLTGNAQDAEDLLQDTYLKLWQKRDDLKEEAVTEAYLVTLMQNLFRDQRRLKRIDSSEDIDDHAEPPDEQSFSHAVEAADETKQMETLMGKLPERDGRILRMHLVEDKSYEEIECDTGLSQGNLRIIMMRTKQKLKEQYLKLTKTWTD
ncbi:MAG: RNA polymerase sigma factor [Bacteroidaceae bacterium]|nr:RNA polymerase sigma factor [Bacteroidaceae bacterium]